MSEPRPYDPLDYRNLTISLVRELMGRSPPASAAQRGGGERTSSRLYR